GLAMPQGLARGLVGALLLLFTVIPAGNADAATTGAPAQDPAAGPVAVATLDQGGGGPTSNTAALDAQGGAGAGGGSASRADPQSGGGQDAGPAGQDAGPGGHVERADKEVVVQPGDTLWGIAETELGDGAKYPELY